MSVIVVTGAAGHIGNNLVRVLLEQGHHVRAIVHHDRRAFEDLDVELADADVCDAASLVAAFTGAEWVYHAAGHVTVATDEWPRLEAVNVRGTQNVVHACQECGVQRLIDFSSIEVLECNPLHTPMDESRPLIGRAHPSPYARSKAAAEQQVRQGLADGLNAVLLYPTAVIGPHDYRLGLPNEGLLGICNGSLAALVQGGFDWVDVRDVARAAAVAGERAPSGGQYLLSGHWASLSELASLIQKLTGCQVPRLVVPMWLARLSVPLMQAISRISRSRPLFTAHALNSLCGNPLISHVRASRDLGYSPRRLEDTVADTVAWFAERGLLTRSNQPAGSV